MPCLLSFCLAVQAALADVQPELHAAGQTLQGPNKHVNHSLLHNMSADAEMICRLWYRVYMECFMWQNSGTRV